MAADEPETKRESDASIERGRRRGSVTIDVPSDQITRRTSDVPASGPKVPVSTAGEDATAGPGAKSAASGSRPRSGDRVAEPPPRAGSPLSLIGFAAIGALVVLLGGYLLMFTDWLPSPGRNLANDALAETERLGVEIEELRRTVAANEPPNVAPLTARVAALEAIAAEIGAIRQAVDGLAAAMDADRAAQAEIVMDLDALRRDVVADAAAAGDPEAAAQLGEEINALSARIALLETAGPPELLFEVQRQLGEIAATVGALTDETAALAADAAERDRATGAARLLAFNNVRAAAERGDVFSDELAILAQLGVDAAAIDALDEAAVAGVPSRAELAAAFGDTAEAILTATTEGDPEGGFWDRLWNNARGIVTVTPTVPVEGDTPGAILSRMQAALDAGDLEIALEERLGLPEAGLAASAEWAARAEARIALEAAVDALEAAVQRRQVE